MPSTRRNVLIGIGGIAAAGGALVGTGAFTTVQAERTVSVETAGDQNAFLQLDTISGSDNSDEYASFDSNDLLEIEIPSVNLNAITHIDDIFQVTNNGTQPVTLYLQEEPGTDNPDGNAIDFGTRTDQITANNVGEGDQPTSNGIVDTDIVDLSSPGPPDSGAGYGDLGVRLAVGDSINIGVYIDTSDENLNDGLSGSNPSDISAGEMLMENLVLWADADAAANNYQFEAA